MNLLYAMVSSGDYIDKLSQGRPIDALVMVYTSLMGDVFWGLIFGMVFLTIYIKSNNVLLPAVTFLSISGVALYALPPESHTFIYLVLALLFALLLVKMYQSKS